VRRTGASIAREAKSFALFLENFRRTTGFLPKPTKTNFANYSLGTRHIRHDHVEKEIDIETDIIITP
jgi:hypothetical protein